MDGQISYPPASGPGRPEALTNSGGTDKNVAGPVWYSSKKGYELNQLISMIIDDIDDPNHTRHGGGMWSICQTILTL